MYAIKQMMILLEDLDSYTQMSVLGSWLFSVNSAIITEAQKYIPTKSDEDSGIEAFTDWEANERKLRVEAHQSVRLSSLVGLRVDLVQMLDSVGGTDRGLEGTLEFLTETKPTEKQFRDEYESRRRMGMKPQMSVRQFVDYELERALNQFNSLVAKGEDAIRLAENIDPSDPSDLPDWMAESFESKFIQKLHARWEKLAFVRCNPKQRKLARDAAEADQMLIAKVLSKYDETPGFASDPEVEATVAVSEDQSQE